MGLLLRASSADWADIYLLSVLNDVGLSLLKEGCLVMTGGYRVRSTTVRAAGVGRLSCLGTCAFFH